MAPLGALWQCPLCGERFATRNQWHSCGRFDVGRLFERSTPGVRALFERFLAEARRLGPVTVIPQKTRVALQVRMRFAALMPRKSHLLGHLVLAARHEAPCFYEIESFSPRNHLHSFRLESEADFTAELLGGLREAYRVGRQEHLERGRSARSAAKKPLRPMRSRRRRAPRG